MPRLNRSPDFRYIFTNGFQLQMTSNEVTLRLCIAEDAADSENSLLEMVGAVMTPTAAKLLASLLTETLANFERDTGTQIPVDEAKMAGLKQLIAEGTKRSVRPKSR